MPSPTGPRRCSRGPAQSSLRAAVGSPTPRRDSKVRSPKTGRCRCNGREPCSVQRRMRRRAAARDTLQAALAAFEELGAHLWADRARAELARIGGRTPAPGGLTPSELRIAELVAEGRTNREVAAALVISVR